MSSEPDLDALQSQDITEVLNATTPTDQDLKNQLGSKKRSHEDMSKDNTASVTEDIDEKILLPESLTVLSRDLTPPMAPPKTIKYDMLPPTQKPPHSGQSGPANLSSQNQPANTVTGNSETQGKISEDVKDDDVDEDTDDDDSPESLNSNPANQISAFDWKELDAKYHKQEETWAAEEQKAFQEFNQLCNYFGNWAQAAHKHEVGRGFKRLKTQATFVQHEESELEKKREHYVKVVEAFKSALQLLSG